MTDPTNADEWDEEVEIVIGLRVKAKPDPKLFEGWMGRTPLDLARYAAYQAGFYDLSRVDGYADLIGDVRVEYVEEH